MCASDHWQVRQLKAENDRLMELGNEARAAATNAKVLLASAPAPCAATGGGAAQPCAGPQHKQRAWLPKPAPGAPPHAAGVPVLCAWPQQWPPWQALPGGWRQPPDGAGWQHGSMPPAQGADEGVASRAETVARQQDAGSGPASAADVMGRQRRVGLPREQPRDGTQARNALQPALAGTRSVLKPGQALVDLQIDGSGRAPVADPPAAHEAAPDGGQKLQTVTRGPRAQGRAQREALRGAERQRQRWPLRRVRNWNDTVDA